MHSGNFNLILHTHLPWVLNHGNWPHGVDWLTEAVAECYIPLLNVFNDLNNEGIKPKTTLDISPVLCEQMEDERFPEIFVNYCNEKIESAKQDEINFKQWGYDKHHIYLAEFWQNWYSERKNDFTEKYNSSIIKSLKKLQDEDAIEIMTCGATHGYFPLLGEDKSINLQVKTAVENYEKHFGRKPSGIWLPECAYRPAYEWQSFIPVAPYNQKRLRPGIEQFLAEHNINYFVIDEKLIKGLQPLGVFHEGNKDFFVDVQSKEFKHNPWNFEKTPLRIYEIASGKNAEYGTAAAFVRHHDIAMQVWSGDIGYPAQPDYLDFHKKQEGSMLRYWRVTDSKADMMYKTLYHPDWIWDKIDHQSNHFIHHIENTLNFNKNLTGKNGTLSAPFDTELFGHWWFEGPEFLRKVIKGLHNSPYVNMATASEEYDNSKTNEVVRIPEGSWGVNNTHEVWSNEENKWTWEAIYNDELRFEKIMRSNAVASLNDMQARILKQAMRELLLLQASDWQFLIYTESAKDYAEQRFSYHHSDFNRLCDIFADYTETGIISENDERYLSETEKRNAVFAEIKLEWWKDLEY